MPQGKELGQERSKETLQRIKLRPGEVVETRPGKEAGQKRGRARSGRMDDIGAFRVVDGGSFIGLEWWQAG